MKSTLLAVAAVIGVTSSALAAEPGRPGEAFNWSGTYLGAYLGYGWGHSDFVDREYNGAPPFPTVRFGFDADGVTGGLQGGYNWQTGRTVIGVEGEFGYLNVTGAKFPPGVDPILNAPYDAAGVLDGGWYAGLGTRLGYTFDRTLLYGKAGGVWSAAKISYIDTCTTAPCGNTTINASDRVGWGYQLGAGVEHALTDSWTIKAEYAFFDFGTTTITGTGAGGGGSNGRSFNVDADLVVHSLKIGANYRF